MRQTSFKVVNSNDLSVLAAVCAEIIAKHPLSDPMKSEMVLVMNGGMQTYLSQEIAHHNGVSAGTEYQQIWVFIWDLYKRLFKESDTLNRFSRDSMSWSLLALKQAWSGISAEDHDDKALRALHERFAGILKPLATYVRDDDESGIKSWQLCHRIADTFDQYQMNRPEWIRLFNELSYEDFDEYEKNPEFHGKVYGALRDASPEGIRAKDGIAVQWRQNVWQMLLWLMVRNNLRGANNGDDDHNQFSLMDRVQVLDQLCRFLSADELPSDLLEEIPERIFIMGVSSMPPMVVEFFRILGRFCNVYLMLINPCMEYWGDIGTGKNALQELRSRMRTAPELADVGPLQGTLKNAEYSNSEARFWDKSDGMLQSGNALLTAMGRQGRDLLSILLSSNEAPDFINCFVKPSGQDVLSTVKRKLLTLDDTERGVISAGDCSMVFSSCHTPRREIEILRDMILEKFAVAAKKGEPLLPRDFLIMTPNIENYAAEIDAVFGAVDTRDPNYIPYAVSDRSVGSDSPVSEAVLKLMNIGTTPVTLSFVISLLQVPEIASSFDISPEDAEVIASWCQKASVKWGLDADETLSEAGVDDLPWTFEAALGRMLTGALTGDDPMGTGEYFDEIEGSDLKILGRFEYFISSLRKLRALFKRYVNDDLHLEDRNDEEDEANSAKPMLLCLGEFFRSFIKDEGGDDKASEFIKTLGGMVKILPSLKHLPRITLPVLRSMLATAFSGKVDESSYLRGSVNFCSLMPMRAVPFKHIFILGLNDGEFPRRENAPGFNLLTLAPFFRRGDRSRFVDDRYLFLEAILAAQCSITFSYIGRNPSDNKPKNPSAVISELQDHLNDSFVVKGCPDKKPSEVLTRNGSLNSYDPKNFMADKTGFGRILPSFDAASFIDTSEAADEDHETVNEVLCPPDGRTMITLPSRQSLTMQDLRDFFKSPCKAYLRTLGISMSSYDEEASDEEDFSLPPLEAALIQKRAVYGKDEEEVQSLLVSLKRAGRLPYGIFAQENSASVMDYRRRMLSALDPFIGIYTREDFTNPKICDLKTLRLAFKASDLEINCELPELTLEISGTALFPALILDPFHKDLSHPKTLWDMAFAALAQALCEDAHPHLVVGIDAKGDAHQFAPFTHDEALCFLREALSWYLRGLVRPLPVYTNALKDPAGEKAEPFGFDEDARFVFRDHNCLNEQSDKAAPLLCALRRAFYEGLYRPYVLEHCLEFIKLKERS